MTKHVEEVNSLIERTTGHMGRLPHSVEIAKTDLLRSAQRLDDLEAMAKASQQIEIFDALNDALGGEKALETPKKPKPKIKMSAQNNFPPDGPALFMEGSNVQHKRPDGSLTPYTKVWHQPADQPNRQSNRTLRLQANGAKPRGTSAPIK